jgi:hypothetical protein
MNSIRLEFSFFQKFFLLLKNPDFMFMQTLHVVVETRPDPSRRRKCYFN